MSRRVYDLPSTDASLWSGIDLDSVREFHSNMVVNADGSCQRWRRNGRTVHPAPVRRPDEFYVPVKHGMYSYGRLTETDLPTFHPADRCPRASR